MSYKDLQYDNLLSKKSNPEEITNLNVDSLIESGAISFGKTDLAVLNNRIIELSVKKGSGDTAFRAGKTDFTNTESGFILGIDDSDSDTAKLYIGDSSEYLNWDGSSLTLTGTITAGSGTIGGWVVTSDAIKDLAGVVGMSSAVTGGDDIRFFAGHATPASAPFKVTEAGVLTASSAIITGTINISNPNDIDGSTITNDDGWTDDTAADAAQSTADARITTFFQTGIPTSLAAGDLWVDTDDSNKLYRATGIGDTTIEAGKWILAQDQDVPQAISDAANAQTTADSKIVTFLQAGVPTATDAGDLWVDTDDDNKLYRATNVGDDEITAGEWVSVQDATIAQAQSDATQAITDAAGAQGTADGKVVTFFQNGVPTSEGAGDLWIDTDDGNKLYRATNAGDDQIIAGEWIEVQDDDIATAISNAATAQNTADSKIVTFYQSAIPTATDAGDFFFDTDDGKMYRSTNIGDTLIQAGQWERTDVGLTPGLIDVLNTTNAPAAANADVTSTIIDGGLVTTGFITLGTSGNIKSGQTAYDTGTGFFLGDVSGTPKFSIGASAGNKLTWDGSALTINGSVITSPKITGIVTGSEIAIQGWTHDMVFSVTDADTIAWSSGTVTLMNGDTYSIDAGNTGNMAAETYIYLDAGTSITVLQATTTKATAVGSGKIMVAVCENATGEAEFVVFGSAEANIDGAKIRAASVTANEITAGTITANEITGSTLSAIYADLGTITAGSISIIAGANTIGLTPAGGNAIFSGTTGSPEFAVTPAGAVTATDIDIGSRRLTVAPGESIQDAIDTLNAGTGGTVFLQNGTHTVTSNITLYSNIYIQGQNFSSAIVDFTNWTRGFKATGTNAYTTGTISIDNNSTTVTGVGTTFASGMVGRSIYLAGGWYPITVFTDTTHITIGIAYASEDLSGVNYAIAIPVEDVRVAGITIKNADAGVKLQYTNQVYCEFVEIQTSVIGYDYDYAANFRIDNGIGIGDENHITLDSCGLGVINGFGGLHTTNAFGGGEYSGVKLTSCHSLMFTGNYILNSVTDGIRITNCKDMSFFATVCTENAGQGIELVSGNTNILFVSCGGRSNGSDGIKLTATSDNCVIGSCAFNDNGGYGINIAAATCDNNVIRNNVYDGNSSGTYNDSGTNTSTDADTTDRITRIFTAGENIAANDAIYIRGNTHSIDLESGSNQFLNIADGDQTGLDLSGDNTIEFLIKFESFGANDTLRYIYSKISTGNEGGYGLKIYNATGTQTLQAEIYETADTTTRDVISWTPSIVTGTWYHFAITVDISAASATTFELFLDSVSQGNGSVNVGDNCASIINNAFDFRIGASGNSDLFEDGLIDDFRVWDDIRTPTEIADNYQKELVGDEDNLVAYWKFNNSLLDETSNNNDLSNNGSAVFSTDTEFDAGTNTAIFKTDASLARTSDGFIGFAISAITSGNEGTTVISGVIAGFTGLLVGTKYYLSDTAGEISTSVGSVTRKVGIAVSTTELLITNIW